MKAEFLSTRPTLYSPDDLRANDTSSTVGRPFSLESLTELGSSTLALATGTLGLKPESRVVNKLSTSSICYLSKLGQCSGCYCKASSFLIASFKHSNSFLSCSFHLRCSSIVLSRAALRSK